MEENKDWKEELQDIINREMFKEDLMIQIKSLVEQELSKARGEGIEEALKEINRTLGTNIEYIDGEYKVVFRRVSKLKDND